MDDAKIEAFALAWYEGRRDGLDAELPGIKPSEAIRISVKMLTLGYMNSEPWKGSSASTEFRKALEAKGC